MPRGLVEMLSDAGPDRSRRVTQAMLQMSRIDIAALKRAYQQG